MSNVYHVPVMLSECIAALDVKPDGVYVDLTFGGGGHSRAILEHLGENGRLFSFDQDADAYRNALDDPRFTFVRGNFRYLGNFLRYYGVGKVDGIMADLGVSSHHFDEEERGFSFRFSGALDMRMNTAQRQTAADVLNTYTEERLADVFYHYGELQQARRIAKAVVVRRAGEPYATVGQFMATVTPFFQREREKKDLAKVFQALRIEVNHEMDALKEMLVQVPQVLRQDGRFVVMTYHSLEDRLVKNFIKTGNCEGKLQKDFYGKPILPLSAVNNRVITPASSELEANPRSRSAKLRVASLS
ncbi:MAG: 16S rRNA (cytosine(1402)-N(4))-methyltransferase RsmH [Candidatus Aphodosoma sp.]